ncbi:hypothetical protein C791_0566 [Amycolatopsis azurea DSM 43854]|uniref:Uncharacterized protein n=1 Tax=Amycolatopsis azurea DSM 43854 TaxID=1238180 RepID=M2PQZ3_9PSEU|nr:hypothetical protein C791_0566 [Amycolatopsis azurea DSM 43854]
MCPDHEWRHHPTLSRFGQVDRPFGRGPVGCTLPSEMKTDTLFKTTERAEA